MIKFMPVLKESSLFKEISDDDMPNMLECLDAHINNYALHDIIIQEGQFISDLGIIVQGQAQITKYDYLGNRTIIADILPGDIFAEAYAFQKGLPVPVNVTSITASEVLWLNCARITAVCPNVCSFHSKLIKNLCLIMASKNILLNRKIEHISRRTTREKLLSYLSDQTFLQGNSEFDIPFNRQELADYLCVDRSAMSSELRRMQDEGLIKYRLNHFELTKIH